MSENACETWHLLIQADHDGELDAGRAADLAAHLATCAACRDMRAALTTLSLRIRADAPRFRAPSSLRRPPAARRRLMLAGSGAAGLALAASLLLVLGQPLSDTGQTEALGLASAHLRALQPGHLTDVLSTDQHTVKPWFAGKIDYSPPVVDLAPEGFPLVGGRLDVLRGKTTAVLVYRRRLHVIDLFVAPGNETSWTRTDQGLNIRAWSSGGMRFEAISDLNPLELAEFASLFHRVP